MPDNSIVYQARLHWILFLWPLVLFFGAIILSIRVVQFYEVGLFLAGFAIIWFSMVAINYLCSSLTIKQNQIILSTGIIVRKTLDIPLNKIESIDIRQTLLGTLFHYGSLVITGTGGSRQAVNYLNKPLTCRRYIEQLMHS